MGKETRFQRIVNAFEAEAITDMIAHTSEIDVTGFDKKLITIEDSHNLEVILTIFGRNSPTGTNFPLATITLTAGAFTKVETVTDPWKHLFFSAIAAASPGSGSLTIKVTEQT